MARSIPKILTLTQVFASIILVQSFLHGDHYDGALGHGLVYDQHAPPHNHQQKSLIASNLPVNAHPLPLAEPSGHQHPHHLLLSEHHSVKQHHLLPLPPSPQPHHLHHPIAEPESHLQQTTIIHHPSEHHPMPEPEIPHHATILKAHHQLGPIAQAENHGDFYVGDHHHGAGPHPEPYPVGHNLQPRFDPSHLAVHGYENFHQTIIPAPEHYQAPPTHHLEQHLIHGAPPSAHHYLPQHHPDGGYHAFYHNRKPGDGFGPGGHFDLMPHQEIKYVPVPEPVPVYKPIPIDKPYPVPVEKPYPVPVERPVPEPYISKVIQPVIHKQAIIKSHVTHLTHEYPHPSHSHHSPGYHKSK